MWKSWLNELRTVALGAAALAAVGLATDHAAALLLAGCVVYLLWHLVQLHHLVRWLGDDGQQRDLPEGRGIWRQVFNRMHRLRRKSRRRKQQLTQVIDRFLEASNAMPDAVVVLRPNGTIEWLNAAAKRLLGLEYPQDLGQYVTNLIRNPAFGEYLARGHHDEALEIPSPENELLRVSIRIVPYGRDRRLLIAHDVTRLHRLERMRQDFVANLSHELRIPITVIKGYVEALDELENPGPKDLERPLRHLKQQTERMANLVSDLVQLSRLDAPPGKRPQSPVRVAEMLERIRDDALSVASEPPAVRVEADPDLRVLGDYNELQSAFSNLLFNAVRHTPASGRITLRWYEDDGGAHLEVEDTGEGIEAHHIPRLTERFYRVDKGRARESGGSGLGLAIVKHALIRHDAQLRIESVLGQGSRFTCDFPRSRVVGPHELAAGS